MTRSIPKTISVGAVLVALATTSSASIAARDKYNITAEEHAACDGDAARLCAESYPDEDKLLACMKARRTELSPVCLAVFKAGLDRRHIPF